MSTNQYDVSVIGLGKLGASMVAGMASRGLRVIGVDVSAATVDAVNQGIAPVEETDLGATIATNKERIRATLDYTDAVHNSPISFVIVPTPSDERGAFSLKYAAECFAAIGKALRTKSDYHVVVLTSTVLPGATRYGLLPILEKESGKTCGKDFGLCYNPEFIALGSVIKNFLNPDFYLLGQFDDRSGDALETVHRKISANRAPVKRMNLENAEIAKIAVNSYVTLKISYANMLADICAHVPGGDIDVVSDAIGTDSRIGRKYLSGGLGFGGPCFPRDNVALAFLGRTVGADTPMLEVNDAYNRAYSGRVLNNFKQWLPGKGKAAVLGLAYKPLSHIVEESAGIFLCQALLQEGYSVMAYDPQAGNEAKKVLGDTVEIAATMEDCLKEADLILVTTPDSIFQALTPEQLRLASSKTPLIDFWRCLPPAIQNSPDIQYLPGGRCLDANAAAEKLAMTWRAYSYGD